MAQQIKSKQRVADHGEVMTGEREVNAMLDLVKQETERVDSRFLEPACGDGNFLTEILRRKLEAAKRRATPPRKKKPLPAEYEKQSVIAITSVYGVDILMDNVQACRERLYGIWNEAYEAICGNEVSEDCRAAVRFILSRNILCGNALSLKTVDEAGKDTDEPIVFASLLERMDMNSFFSAAAESGLRQLTEHIRIVMETDFPVLRVAGTDYPTEEVRAAYDQLTREDVKEILNDFCSDPLSFGSMRARLFEAGRRHGIGNGTVLASNDCVYTQSAC